MTRLEATRIIVELAGSAPVVASLGHPAYDLFAAGDRPQNFYTWGSMGLASSVGLGLALARPDVRVFVLDGDGSLLMNLGSLATIGLLRPSNLVLVVMDNEEYATTGGQPTPTAHGADLEAAARAMGIAATATVRNEAELRSAVARRAACATGSLFIVAKVSESAPTAKPPLDCVFIKQRFMAAIGNPETATGGAATVNLAAFVVPADPPAAARTIAARAFLDTIGVTLAGAAEPAARIVQRVIAQDGGGPCRVLGTGWRSSAANAALANGTAAHALDYDDMCFVSLAHPSAPLVAAAVAAAELAGASGRAVLDAYVVGFEIEGRLGRAMNPRHYQRGWHCTATLGTIGAAAAASRLLGLDAAATRHALAIAASEASGLKENFGTMVKPLHAGLAARNGIVAALLAQAGMTASDAAIDGPQGFLAAMDSEQPSLAPFAADLGARWEIVDTGITVKLYPSCAGTHPTLDALLDLQRRERFSAADVDTIDAGVDAIVPTILLYDRPSSGLEGKFSLPFCAAAAVVHGTVGIDDVRRRAAARSGGDGDAGARDDARRSDARSDGAVVDPGAGDRAPARRTSADGARERRARLPGSPGQRRRAGHQVQRMRDDRAVRLRRGRRTRPAARDRISRRHPDDHCGGGVAGLKPCATGRKPRRYALSVAECGAARQGCDCPGT